MSRLLSRSLNFPKTAPSSFRAVHHAPLHNIKDDVLKRRGKSIFKEPLKKELVDTERQLSELRRLSHEVRVLLKQRATEAREEMLKRELNFTTREERTGHLPESESHSETIYKLLSEENMHTESLSSDGSEIARSLPGSSTESSVEASSLPSRADASPDSASEFADGLFSFPEKLDMPPAVVAKFGDYIRFLTDTKHQDWRKVLAFLKRDRDGFAGLAVEDVNVLVGKIPAKQRVALVPYLDHMFATAGLRGDARTCLLYMDAFATMHMHNAAEQLWAARREQLLAAGPAIATVAYGVLIKAYSKQQDLARMNAAIIEMKEEHGLAPTKEIYTNVMQACIRLRDFTGATDIFRMLKFLGEATRPDEVAYTSIIMMHVQNNDIEQALDIYSELDEARHNSKLVVRTKKQKHISVATEAIRPSLAMLNALANGCARRAEYRLKGWEFVFQIDAMGLEPDVPTMEAMMHLSARDGDLDFARALFHKLSESNSVSRAAVNYLMLAYFKYDFQKTIHEKVRPTVELHEKGLNFRQNIITQFMRSMKRYLESSPAQQIAGARSPPPPFLPLCSFQSYEQTVKESGAIWAYLTLLKPHTLSVQAVGSYLLAAQMKGSNSEFRRRFDECTYLERDPVGSEQPKVVVEEAETEAEAQPEMPSAIARARQSQVKFPRNHHIYSIALQTASVNESINFAQRIWVERGEWRKTRMFQEQPKAVRMTQDFEFAQNMVITFSNLGLLNEALIIVKSTMKQFKWEFHQLAPLFQKATQYGNSYVAETVSDICNEHKPKLQRFQAYLRKSR